MSGAVVIFYLLAALVLGSGLLAVTSRQLFRSAIYLLFSLIGIAGLFFWMEYEFVAAVQIVVYVGGIVVLIIFSIFLTQSAGEKLPPPKGSRQLFAGLAAFCGLALTLLQVFKHTYMPANANTEAPTVANIGHRMLSIREGGMALPFEVVSILLLAAMIGCIVIAIKSKPITD
ncbi:MAG: NADH-quinone oxidoreductase subunit J [Ferruginibacter sp.]